MSEAWRMNSDVTWQWEGTWRERRGMHTFIQFSLTPEFLGLFENTFWNKTVIQASFSDSAVFHIASAIGALREHIFQQYFNSGLKDSDGLAFALRQCNRAINLLVGSSNGKKPTSQDPGVPLITCVLFAIFEALQGCTEQAITHSLQGRKLLHDCETLKNVGKGSRLLDTTAVVPVIGGLEIQAKALQGKWMENVDSNEPDLPDMERIHSLDQAHWMLHSTYISLLVYCQRVSLAASPSHIASKMAHKLLVFGPWLKEWEQYFAQFLFREAKQLDEQDMQRAKVLKANHLAATMIATIDQGGNKDAWERYKDECKAIIDLSASVLNTYSLEAQPTLTGCCFPYLTCGLWIAEP